MIPVLCALAGYFAASASAFAYAKLHAWRSHGEAFQLGYVVGYLDAVTLMKRSDRRAYNVPMVLSERPDYARWRDEVNEYFRDPANAKRSIPDAMGAIGARISREQLDRIIDRERGRATPAPSPSS
jgi:hypothetical protein